MYGLTIGSRMPVDQVFERMFDGFTGLESLWGLDEPKTRTPVVRVTEEDDVFRLDAELPGVKPNEVSLVCENGILSLKVEQEEGNTERNYSYKRYFKAADVEIDSVEATLKDGILTVVLPKTEGIKRKVIKVK